MNWLEKNGWGFSDIESGYKKNESFLYFAKEKQYVYVAFVLRIF
jgi:hypothetical protein